MSDENDESYLFPSEKEWRKKRRRIALIDDYIDDLPYDMKDFIRTNGTIGYVYAIEPRYLISQLEISLKESKRARAILNFFSLNHDEKKLLYHVKVHLVDNSFHVAVLKEDDPNATAIIISCEDMTRVFKDLDRAIEFLSNDF